MADRTTERTEITVGPFAYTRRPYTPKRRGASAGWGWYREWNGKRAEVGMEAKILVDRIDELSCSLAFAIERLADDEPSDGDELAAVLAELRATLEDTDATPPPA